MINFSEDQIKEIASTLECGLTCFINKKTGKVNNVLNIQDWDLRDDIPAENILEDPGAKWYDYIEINPMPAKDVFKIMEEFVKTVDNHELSEKLLGALDNKQPFKNFKWLIERSEEYRQKWFDFRSKEYIIWVRNYLNQLKLT